VEPVFAAGDPVVENQTPMAECRGQPFCIEAFVFMIGKS
jgi:hypothetical protein